MKRNRYPLYHQVEQYSSCIGPVLSHLKCYSDSDATNTIDAFKRVHEIVYQFYMNNLMLERPNKEEGLDKCLAHNDSVHTMRQRRGRFLEKVRQIMDRRFGHGT